MRRNVMQISIRNEKKHFDLFWLIKQKTSSKHQFLLKLEHFSYMIQCASKSQSNRYSKATAQTSYSLGLVCFFSRVKRLLSTDDDHISEDSLSLIVLQKVSCLMCFHLSLCCILHANKWVIFWSVLAELHIFWFLCSNHLLQISVNLHTFIKYYEQDC